MYVFGSFARNDVGPRSDLDVLVVMRTVLQGPARGEELVVRALPGVAFDLKVLTLKNSSEPTMLLVSGKTC